MRGYFQQNLSWSLRSTTICTETLIEFHGNKVNKKRGKTERESNRKLIEEKWSSLNDN